MKFFLGHAIKAVSLQRVLVDISCLGCALEVVEWSSCLCNRAFLFWYMSGNRFEISLFIEDGLVQMFISERFNSWSIVYVLSALELLLMWSKLARLNFNGGTLLPVLKDLLDLSCLHETAPLFGYRIVKHVDRYITARLHWSFLLWRCFNRCACGRGLNCRPS